MENAIIIENNHEITERNDKLNDLATRIYDLVPWWDRESDSMQETIDTLKNDPMAVIEYLLDIVDNYR